ncbi:spore germination protein, partial [Bacillus altitudinis]|uniref:spore germination protein n=1 Tax=Bacillus altitudinis TaxID=293387 RepID=UPI001643E34A
LLQNPLLNHQLSKLQTLHQPLHQLLSALLPLVLQAQNCPFIIHLTTYPPTIPHQPHTQNLLTPPTHPFLQNIILNTPLIPTTLRHQKLPYKILKLGHRSKP